MKYFFTSIAVVLLASLAVAQGSSGVSLSSQLSFPIGTCADVWAEGDHVFIARRGEGFEIIDASDPANPQTLHSGRSDLFIQDVKVSGNLMFASNESGNGQSMIIFDISNPTAPTELGSFGALSMFSCNNLALYGNYAYCCSLTSNTVVILDVSNPTAPTQVGQISSQSPISLIHDVAVEGDKLYISWLSGGFEVHDLASNPASPSLDLFHLVPTSLIHNTWPLGGDYIVTTDEVSGGYLRVWDASNPSNVQQVSEWRASGVAVMHNLYIVGTFAFITNYTEGLRIVDLSNPTNPVEAGFYDTFPMVNPFQFGAWGVHVNGDRIYVADFNTGLYVLDFTPVTGALSAASNAVNFGSTIMLTYSADSANASVDIPGMIDLSFSVPSMNLLPASLLTVTGTMPPGVNTGPLLFDIPLPPAPNFPTTVVDFTLTIADQTGALIFDQQTVSITLN